MNIIKAPEPYKHSDNDLTVFLAGSIEMGAAPDWQENISRFICDLDIVVLNPRRDDWDSSQPQIYENKYFRDQVNWELDNLEQADIIFLYLHPETISPISLMELGKHAEDRIIVCCPPGYFRKGNVGIFCKRYNIPLIESLYKGKLYLRKTINEELRRRKTVGESS